MQLVQPRLSRGLRDLLPEDTLARQAMIDVVRGVYELYGFVPLTTPDVCVRMSRICTSRSTGTV